MGNPPPPPPPSPPRLLFAAAVTTDRRRGWCVAALAGAALATSSCTRRLHARGNHDVILDRRSFVVRRRHLHGGDAIERDSHRRPPRRTRSRKGLAPGRRGAWQWRRQGRPEPQQSDETLRTSNAPHQGYQQNKRSGCDFSLG